MEGGDMEAVGAMTTVSGEVSQPCLGCGPHHDARRLAGLRNPMQSSHGGAVIHPAPPAHASPPKRPLSFPAYAPMPMCRIRSKAAVRFSDAGATLVDAAQGATASGLDITINAGGFSLRRPIGMRRILEGKEFHSGFASPSRVLSTDGSASPVARSVNSREQDSHIQKKRVAAPACANSGASTA